MFIKIASNQRFLWNLNSLSAGDTPFSNNLANTMISYGLAPFVALSSTAIMAIKGKNDKDACFVFGNSVHTLRWRIWLTLFQIQFRWM